MSLKTFPQYFAELAGEVGRKICQYTPSLITDAYAKDAKRVTSKRVPVGSSVLFRVDHRYFLVTAAHVFKRYNLNTLGLCNNKDFYRLDGQLRMSNPNVDEEDKIDVAVFELTQNFVASIPDCFQFYDIKLFNVDHADKDGMRYLLVGSPLTRYKLKLGEGMTYNIPFIFRTHKIDSVSTMRKLGARDQSHLIVNYTRKGVHRRNDSRKITGPALNGMSGSGIWMISNIVPGLDFSYVSFFPTAILTEYEPAHHCVLGTRMKVVTEIMRQFFDVDLPKSRTIDFDFTTEKKI